MVPSGTLKPVGWNLSRDCPGESAVALWDAQRRDARDACRKDRAAGRRSLPDAIIAAAAEDMKGPGMAGPLRAAEGLSGAVGVRRTVCGPGEATRRPCQKKTKEPSLWLLLQADIFLQGGLFACLFWNNL